MSSRRVGSVGFRLSPRLPGFLSPRPHLARYARSTGAASSVLGPRSKPCLPSFWSGLVWSRKSGPGSAARKEHPVSSSSCGVEKDRTVFLTPSKTRVRTPPYPPVPTRARARARARATQRDASCRRVLAQHRRPFPSRAPRSSRVDISNVADDFVDS
ncbi:uncharacterized protein PSFLO_02142 [Pseudozyma flocculosa]|uniref:Uncharacterized protein n=1 Tax=Pseudozyma flocculosa TaxID=84751 RepID=A0A5C3F095_9BASI|nr:uncharacterized protein PSFLO_02142 [Pseudozyma flocculosa]